MKKLIAFLLCALFATLTACGDYAVTPVADVPLDTLILVK